MQVEVLDALSDALRDEATGMVAQLQVLPMSPGDVLPITDVLIVNGLRDAAAVKGEQFDRGVDVLALCVPDGPTRFVPGHVKGEYSNGITPVAITMIHRGGVDADVKARQCIYVMRSCILALAAYFRQNVADRTVNQIVVSRLTDLLEGLVVNDGVGGVAALAFKVEALDLRAQRTI